MANESFDFDVSKFLTEQKHLLALERERFAAEKIRILEPESASSPGKVEHKAAASPGNGKSVKNNLNSKIVSGETRPGKDLPEWRDPDSGDKENQSDNSGKRKSDGDGGEECPAERRRLRTSGNGDDSLKIVHFESGAKDLSSSKVHQDNSTTKRNDEPVSSPNPGKQQDEMEKWVSDTFYSYFPSFNKTENEKKSMLSRARQAEYQEYLKNIPQVTTKHQQYMEKYGDQAVQTMTDTVPETDATTTKNYLSPHSNLHHHQHQQQSTPYNSPSQIPTIKKTLASDAGTGSYVRKGSPREKHMQDLVHTDLSAIVNTDSVDRRNRMLAEEESRRKLEYQKELIKQIEEKRKEVERLREKEKLEEEMLTRFPPSNVPW